MYMLCLGLGQDVALITDGRFSGGSHGFIIGHISPEVNYIFVWTFLFYLFTCLLLIFFLLFLSYLYYPNYCYFIITTTIRQGSSRRTNSLIKRWRQNQNWCQGYLKQQNLNSFLLHELMIYNNPISRIDINLYFMRSYLTF